MGIEKNQKEPTKTSMMISNWKKHFSLHGFNENNSALKGLIDFKLQM